MFEAKPTVINNLKERVTTIENPERFMTTLMTNGALVINCPLESSRSPDPVQLCLGVAVHVAKDCADARWLSRPWARSPQ